MNGMVERVAKTLWDLDQKNVARFGVSNGILFGDHWHRKVVPWGHLLTEHVVDHIAMEWRAKAIAVIKALREPTEAMVKTVDEAAYGYGDDSWKWVWQTMIDAILEEKA